MLTLSGMFAAGWATAVRFGLVGSATVAPAIFLMLVVGLALVAMLRVTRRFVSPLDAVMDAADRVAEGDYGVRVQESGPPPMRALAHSFNAMTERLQNADRLRRNLMADVAHELRTPLTVLQGRLEGLIDGVYSRDDRQLSQLLDDTRVLSRLVDDLRTLALSEAGALQLQKELTDVAALVQEVVGSMQAEAAGKSVSLTAISSADSALLDLDPVRIREVLTNLLSNAIRHTPGGGAVTVSVSDAPAGTTVAVSDTGEGMPANEAARIFDRFYKGSTSRGSGLGLTIAKGLVTAHGGEINASSQLDRGTTVVFTLPRSPDTNETAS